MSIETNESLKFSSIADEWWNPKSKSFKILHRFNAIRVQYIMRYIGATSGKILDVGCGGGVLGECLARLGFEVTGIDLSQNSVEAAKQHAHFENLDINYINTDIQSLNAESFYDFITCFEVLEHTESMYVDILRKANTLLKPGGMMFVSTINKNLKSMIFAKIAAEYIFNLVPKGTHDFKHFITPQKLTQDLKNCGFSLIDLSGLFYNPLTFEFKLTNKTDIQYIACFKKI